MAVTVKEIAEIAGVSKSAVSKVLNNSTSNIRVSEDKAAQIREVALNLGYVPNLNAKILRHSKTNTIGVYFDDLAGIDAGPLYTTYLLAGICKTVFQRHYRVTLVSELDHEDAVKSLSDGRLDGVIWCRVVRDRKTVNVIEKSPIPVVTLGGIDVSGAKNLATVSCDTVSGIRAAVQHLIELGHSRIAFLNEAREADASDCVDRREAFLGCMAKAGLSVEPHMILSWSWELEEFADWWSERPNCSAVVCWSERAAGRLLRRCVEFCVEVPKELSVIGFDSTQYCETTRPTLTAVRQPVGEMSAAAATLLMNMIEGLPTDPHPPIFACPLDIRFSTTGPSTK